MKIIKKRSFLFRDMNIYYFDLEDTIKDYYIINVFKKKELKLFGFKYFSYYVKYCAPFKANKNNLELGVSIEIVLERKMIEKQSILFSHFDGYIGFTPDEKSQLIRDNKLNKLLKK